MAVHESATVSMTLSAEEREFFVSLGERIASLRRDHAVTQVKLAEVRSMSQQTMQSYEVDRRRIPVSVMARTLSGLHDELFGEAPTKPARSRRGAVPQWRDCIEAIAKLPRTQQRFVTQMLKTVLAQQARS